MLRSLVALAAALLLSACVTTGMAPIVPASPAGGPPLDPAVVAYLTKSEWRAAKDPSTNAACIENALPSYSFVHHKGRLQVVRVDNGRLLAALFTVFVSVLVDDPEILVSAQSDGGALALQSTKGSGRDRSEFSLRLVPTGPDSMDLVSSTFSVVRAGLRENKSDTRVTKLRRCPADETPQKKRA
jgi:hypothetical protein